MARRRRNKYGNIKLWAYENAPYTAFASKAEALASGNEDNGTLHKFDSKAEYYHYLSLLERVADGAISNLELQPRYELQPKCRVDGKSIAAITYSADFAYKENGALIIVDVKGRRTAVFNIKWKMLKYLLQHEINLGKTILKIVKA